MNSILISLLATLCINQSFAIAPFDLSAHRGDQAKHIENTIGAFEDAIKNGARSIEFDVHLTRDGVAVIYHDFILSAKRFVGLDEDRYINELSYVEISKLVYSSSNSRILTLDELFESMSELKKEKYKFIMHMEIKVDESTNKNLMLKTISHKIRRSALRERVIVRSFDIDFLISFKKVAKSIKQVLLFEQGEIPSQKELSKIQKILNAQAIAPFYGDVDRELIQRSRKLNLQVLPWTVDNLAEAIKLINLGVSGITTNYPQRFATLVKNTNDSGECFFNLHQLLITK